MINATMAALVEELSGEGMDNPIAQSLTLGFIWSDLARIAGEPIPADVAALVDTPAATLAPNAQDVWPCEGCGGPVGDDGYVDQDLSVAVCGACSEADAEYARSAW